MWSRSDQDKDFGHKFLHEIADYIAAHFRPEEIFDQEVLTKWAVDNGYKTNEKVNTD